VTSLPSLGPRGEGWVLIQGVLLVAIGLGGLAETPFSAEVVTAGSVAGLLLLVAGGLMAVLGVWQLGSALTALPHPRDGGNLVETGVYRFVRHPIYGGLVIAALGYGLVMHAPITAIAGSAVLLVFFRLKSAREEVWLAARYPGYAAYRARTRRILPLVY
jgi:protein-S-isoprenylcysteine O-methyltransferase Ste14